jgi:hypothetical protein
VWRSAQKTPLCGVPTAVFALARPGHERLVGGCGDGKVHVRQHAALPPERFISALTNFGPDRGEFFGNSEPGQLQLHDRGDTWADVTEGSKAGGGIWQRYRYDWSTPGLVTLDVVDSNAFGPGSRWVYRVTSDAAGESDIDLTIHRNPTTAKGRVLDVLLRFGGSAFFARDLRKAVRRLEERTRSHA